MSLKLVHWMIVLILFIKLNTNFLLKGEKFKPSQIRNSQDELKNEGTFINTLNTLLKATFTLPIVCLRYLVHIGQQYKLEQYVLKRVILTPVVQCLKLRISIFFPCIYVSSLFNLLM